MKNLLRILAFVCALQLTVSCSDDDTNTTQAGTWQTNLKVNGNAFTPVSTDDVTTTATYGAPDVQERTFNLTVPAANNQEEATIFIHLVTSGTDASGTYTTANDQMYGVYSIGDTSYYFAQGSTIQVNDLGDNTFKITFNNIQASNNIADTVNIKGSFSGPFKYVMNEI